ncbi:MAG TPA: FAD-dependent oxidoreductase [Solirubrobacteraceae bacterium]|nr:FAD-dependent oxidoreductase [Solirubrobacteraceae bacterium]
MAGRSIRRSKVVIVGGGVAGLECLLALRALTRELTDLTLISQSPQFVYRPMATVLAFNEMPPPAYDLRQITADLGVRFHGEAIDAVLPPAQAVRLKSGREVSYDALVLAMGARADVAVPGALTFRDQRDVPRFRGLLDLLEARTIERLVFAVPSRHCWSLPAYELALFAAMLCAKRGIKADLSVVTPEDSPLAVFGREPSRVVASLLADRGIQFVAGPLAHSVTRDGSLDLAFNGSLPADRVVALPELHVPRISGVPGTWGGFVPTLPNGRVEGVRHVYAAGDLTTFPVKQGGLAAQQADRVAYTIAAGFGARIKEMRPQPILRARLLTGDGALVLRTELDSLGQPTASSVQHLESRRAEHLKVFGRYLTPYLSTYASGPGGTTVAVA